METGQHDGRDHFMDRVTTGRRRQKRERGQDWRWATGYGNGEPAGTQGSGKLGTRAGKGAGLQFIGGDGVEVKGERGDNCMAVKRERS